MRLGVSYQGKDVVGICFDDIASYISSGTPTQIRDSIKAFGMGKHNVSKGFVLKESINHIVKRPSNSYSRKSSVVWVDKLPNPLQENLRQGLLPSIHKFYSNYIVVV